MSTRRCVPRKGWHKALALVEAATPAQARLDVARKLFAVDIPGPRVLADLAKLGIDMDNAGGA